MTHQPHFGLRAQLRNYFARHATFSVQITIHELTNVPLVSGDFACRWRVKGAQALPSVIRRDSTSAKSVRSDGGSASGSGSSSREKAGAAKDAEIEVQVHPPSPPMNPTARGSVSTIPSLNSGRSTPSDSDKPIGSFLMLDESGSLDHSDEDVLWEPPERPRG